MRWSIGNIYCKTKHGSIGNEATCVTNTITEHWSGVQHDIRERSQFFISHLLSNQHEFVWLYYKFAPYLFCFLAQCKILLPFGPQTVQIKPCDTHRGDMFVGTAQRHLKRERPHAHTASFGSGQMTVTKSFNSRTVLKFNIKVAYFT